MQTQVKTNLKNTILSIFNENYSKFKGTAYFITKDISIAEDVVQESCLKILNLNLSTQSIPMETQSIVRWLYRIVRNTAIDFCRKRKRWNDLTTYIPETDSRIVDKSEKSCEEILEEKIVNKTILDLIMKLPIYYQEVVRLKIFYDFTLKEIASLLEINEKTAKSRWNRGITKIKEYCIKCKNILNMGAISNVYFVYNYEGE